MTQIENIVRSHVSRLLPQAGLSPGDVELDRSLSRGYGLTSMKMVLLMTALCEEIGVLLSSLTDRDLASLDTSRDVINLMLNAPKTIA